jgi:hypothetical protein
MDGWMDGWLLVEDTKNPKFLPLQFLLQTFFFFLFLFFTFKALLLDIPDGGRRAAELVGIGYRILDGRTGGTRLDWNFSFLFTLPP